MEDAELRNRLGQIDSRFDQFDVRFDKMEALILQEGERTRAHIDAFAKRFEDRIKLVAEGYAALRTDVTELKHGQQHLISEHSHLDVHILAVASRVVSVDSRVTGVEKIQKIILTEVRGLATKVDRLSKDQES
jgi:hypothetical protein